MNRQDMRKFVGLAAQAVAIRDCDERAVSWKTKYDLIFSEDLSRAVFKLVRLDYCDPDTSYEDDVRAFVSALEDKAAELRDVLIALGAKEDDE